MIRNYLFKIKPLLVSRPVLLSSVCHNSKLRKIFYKLERKRMEQEKINGKSVNKIQDKLTPASISFIVVGNGGIATPKSIFISTSEDSYLIGCSENVYRLAISLGVKPFKPKHIFITSARWPNIGGLIGLGMNLEVTGSNSVTVHGSRKLEDLFSSSRLFGISAGIKLICNTLDNTFQDDCFTVNKFELSPFDNEFKRQKTESNHEYKVFNYHFKVNDRTGRLDLNKCIELKVPVGPLLRKLKSGEDIKLDDGRIIKHSDVCAPATVGEEILIIDCPTICYLNSLIKNEDLNNIIEKKDSQLKYVFHLSDIDVVLDNKYQEWINKFSSNVQHIGLNEYCANLSYLPNHFQIYQFNHFDSDLFKQLYFDNENKKLPFESRLRPAKQLEIFNFGIKKYFKDFERVEMNYEELDKERNQIENLDKAIIEYKDKIKDIKNEIIYPEITFTGTASAAPGKYRNSSGIFISLNENETCILDCGEGTLYGIIRHFGPKKYLEKLNQLKFIYSSHLHADHHIGLINILLDYRKSIIQLNKRPKQKLKLFLPTAVNDFLELYNQNFETIKDLYDVIAHPIKERTVILRDEIKTISDSLEELIITKVPHCFQSTGIALTTKDSKGNHFKLVYSGDCLPAESLVRVGKDCDLLIHEATFSEHYEDEAIRKRHTTSEQAIEQRDKMNAKFLILTHFSQRYAKVPLTSKKYDDRVGAAFDYLTINPSNLKKTVHFKDIVHVLYKEDVDEINSNIERRAKQNELLKKYMRDQQFKSREKN